MGIRLSEHKNYSIRYSETENKDSESSTEWIMDSEKFALLESAVSKPFNASTHKFWIHKKEFEYQIQADYCIGIDWLGNTGRYLYVEPKINKSTIQSFVQQIELEEEITVEKEIDHKLYELDYLQMLLHVTKVAESSFEVKDLLQIDWDSKHIEIEQKDDKLTPFLIINFLQALKSIVRKGLKKNYYKVQENLTNRVKGKILVGHQIKQNILKNRFTATYCEYQVFGEDHLENRFLKKVFTFAVSYVENHKLLLAQNYKAIQETINYCRPAFELISENVTENELKHIKHNPFYKDYKNAIQIGSYILKKFAYNITETTKEKVKTPPFWIDMPRLFELYVYAKMIEHNTMSKNEIHYQFNTYGNSLDILVSHPEHQTVIDTKYKLHYQKGHLHQDIRQVAGYARLKKVRNILKLSDNDDQNIDCLLIYPDMENGIDDLSFENIKLKKEEIKAYHKVYKLGISLPIIR